MEGAKRKRRKLVSPIKVLKLFIQNFKEHVTRCVEIDRANSRAGFRASKKQGNRENPMQQFSPSTKSEGKKKYQDLSECEDDEEIGIEMEGSARLTHRRNPNA